MAKSNTRCRYVPTFVAPQGSLHSLLGLGAWFGFALAILAVFAKFTKNDVEWTVIDWVGISDVGSR